MLKQENQALNERPIEGKKQQSWKIPLRLGSCSVANSSNPTTPTQSLQELQRLWEDAS